MSIKCDFCLSDETMLIIECQKKGLGDSVYFETLEICGDYYGHVCNFCCQQIKKMLFAYKKGIMEQIIIK